jgi:hypothetical protein
LHAMFAPVQVRGADGGEGSDAVQGSDDSGGVVPGVGIGAKSRPTMTPPFGLCKGLNLQAIR